MLTRPRHLIKRATARLISTPQQLKALKHHTDSTTAQLGQAISEGIYQHLTPDETRWVERIEAVRTQLRNCNDVIRFKDFGAGKPEDAFSEVEMASGNFKEVTVAESSAAATTRRWALVLFKLIRHLKPAHCLEFGTHMGISAAYQGAALELNGGGKLITLEGGEALAGIARQNLHMLGLQTVEVRVGRFQDTLQGALDTLGQIDYAFIDGHHEETATLNYFEWLLPYLSERAVLIFDDHHWNAGMTQAWEAIIAHEHVHTAIDMPPFGICTVYPSRQETSLYRVV